jgi:hypothetical protein
MIKKDKFALIIIFIGIFSIYAQPIIFNYPIYYDSGVFSYVGSIINDGRLPYLDVWDHKGLWIYFQNAFGLIIGFNNIRGVYILECFILIISVFSSYRLICHSKGISMDRAVIFFVGLIGSYALLFEGGNHPETNVFPWQLIFYVTALIWLIDDIKSRKLTLILSFVSATAIVAALFTRPNNGFGIMLLSAFLFINGGALFRKYITLFIITFLAFFSLYIINKGIYNEMLNNYYNYNVYYSKIYNLLYSNESILFKIKNSLLYILIIFLSPMGLLLLYRVKKIRSFFSEKYKNISIFLFVLVVDVLSQMISGRAGPGYLHYAIIVLPSIFVLCLIFCTLNVPDYSNLCKRFVVTYTIILILAFNYSAYSREYHLAGIKDQMVTAVQKLSKPEDKIFVSWADAWIYVSANRYSFTRFIYPNPVSHSEFDGKDRLAIVKSDYLNSPPKLVVDWKNFLFADGFSNYNISFLREKFSTDYSVFESNDFYTIYLRK